MSFVQNGDVHCKAIEVRRSAEDMQKDCKLEVLQISIEQPYVTGNYELSKHTQTGLQVSTEQPYVAFEV